MDCFLQNGWATKVVLASFPTATIVAETYHSKSLTPRQPDLNLRLNLGFVHWSCALVITTTLHRQIGNTKNNGGCFLHHKTYFLIGEAKF